MCIKSLGFNMQSLHVIQQYALVFVQCRNICIKPIKCLLVFLDMSCNININNIKWCPIFWSFMQYPHVGIKYASTMGKKKKKKHQGKKENNKEENEIIVIRKIIF